MKTKLKASFTTAVGEVNGQPANQVAAMRAKNPQMFDVAMHYYVQLGMFNIDAQGNLKPDMKALKRNATSEATNSLLDIATNQSAEVGNGGAGGGGIQAKTLVDLLDKMEN